MGIDMCPPVDCRNALFRQPEDEMNEKAAFDEGGFYYIDDEKKLEHQRPHLEHEERHEPCQHKAVDDREEGPAAASLAAEGGDGGDAGEVEQHEHQEGVGFDGVKKGLERNDSSNLLSLS